MLSYENLSCPICVCRHELWSNRGHGQRAWKANMRTTSPYCGEAMLVNQSHVCSVVLLHAFRPEPRKAACQPRPALGPLSVTPQGGAGSGHAVFLFLASLTPGMLCSTQTFKKLFYFYNCFLLNLFKKKITFPSREGIPCKYMRPKVVQGAAVLEICQSCWSLALFPTPVSRLGFCRDPSTAQTTDAQPAEADSPSHSTCRIRAEERAGRIISPKPQVIGCGLELKQQISVN